MIVRLIGEGTRCGLYDVASGHLVERAEPISTQTGPQGWYRELDGQFVALYCVEGQAWVRIGGVAQVCTSPAAVSWVRQDNGVARLSLIDGDELSASVVYYGADTSGIPPEVDFTMSDPEDFDFGEFISRRLRNPSALARVAGDSSTFDPSAQRSSGASAALEALPEPTFEGDLGPLRRFDVLEYQVSRNPSTHDRELLDFLRSAKSAPPVGEDGVPPVMPVALACGDPEREVFRVFAGRAARRAVRENLPELLSAAAVAAALGGLDCVPESASLRRALHAVDEVTTAMNTLGESAHDLVESISPILGPVATWRFRDRVDVPNN
jgi:hypothetical protein